MSDGLRLPPPFTSVGPHIAIELTPGAHALFTTRRGGFSKDPFASLNLGRLTDDDPDDVRRNRDALEQQLGVRLASGRQVHGNRVVRVTAVPDEHVDREEADGRATALKGVGTMALTADCLPIAIAATGAVAMVHAGWRGLAAGVIGEGARAVHELGGTGPLVAAIGPGAGPCCYEVGDEIHAAFAGEGNGLRHGANLDLKAIARRQLEQAGVEIVHDVALCTICSSPTLLYSHRRDRGLTGRQAGIAWLS